MGTIANAKVTHYYNCYNGYFVGCLRQKQESGKKILINGFIFLDSSYICPKMPSHSFIHEGNT